MLQVFTFIAICACFSFQPDAIMYILLLNIEKSPKVDTQTLRNGTLTEHYFADTINLLVSIGEQTVTAINSNVPVSPFPYNVSTHMDIDSRIQSFDSKNHSTQV
jgi:hypothetical protein